jgi:hypothetical protein
MTKPITQERIDELAAMLRAGAASDEAEREIREAAQMVPQLVDSMTKTPAPWQYALLKSAIALHEQIVSLAGESSVIDEDLEKGEPLAALRAAIARATE